VSGDALRFLFPTKATPTEAAPWRIVLSLALIGIVSRWLLRGRLVYDQEAASLVFAAFHGEVPGGSVGTPTGPLYLALGRALLPLFGSPEGLFVAISVLASGLAFISIYLLAAGLMGELAGVFAVALLVSSPLFWFFGIVGLPYAVDALIAIVTAYLSWQLMAGQRWVLAPLALTLVLAGGLRPWAALIMLPLALYAAISTPRSAARRAARRAAPQLASAVLALACLLPIGLLAGDLWARPSNTNTLKGSSGLLHQLASLVGATGWGWGLAALPVLGVLLLWALGVPGFGARHLRPGDHRAWFYTTWAAPWLLYLLLARGEVTGHLAVGLPLLLLWTADALVRLISASARRLATIAAALIICGNTALFLLVPERPLLGYRLPTAANVAYHDRRLAAAIVAIRGFSPDETLILADQWLPVRYYLPHYSLLPYHPDGSAPRPMLVTSLRQPAEARDASALLWFEQTLDAHNTSPAETELQAMAVGTLRILRPLPTEELVVEAGQFGLRRKTLRK
jgi:hypothetical protein